MRQNKTARAERRCAPEPEERRNDREEAEGKGI